MTDLVTRVAVLLANIQYTGSAYEDWDVWTEEATSDEQEIHLGHAQDILDAIEGL